MDRSHFPPLRSLPRVFLNFAEEFKEMLPSEIAVPAEELKKFRNVLRLSSGDQVAVLSGDGRIIRSELRGRVLVPVEVEALNTGPALKITLLQALPKPDRLETLVRMCTELGVSKFILFPSDRSVVCWEKKRLKQRLERLQRIIQESAEQCFASKLPDLEYTQGLDQALEKHPDTFVLSELESVTRRLALSSKKEVGLMVGPEGGWSPREVEKIQSRSFSLGKRVLRVDTAAVVACSILFALSD